MAKRQRMTTYNRGEVKDALDTYGFVVSRRGKGAHKIYEHKVFGDMISFEISDHGDVDENVYKKLVGAFALLTLTTDSNPEDLGGKGLHKLQKSVEVSLRNQGYRTFMSQMLKFYHEKVIKKMHEQYKAYEAKNANKKGDDPDEFLEDRRSICQAVIDKIDDKEALYVVLQQIFIDSEVYDEKLSVLVSQSLVQALVDRFERTNGAYYRSLLLQIHTDFGFRNGGCILFDYYTTNPKDKIALLRDRKIYEEYKRNQAEVLSQKECPSPRSIYRMNYDDFKFLKKLITRYPKFGDRGNKNVNSVGDESVNM